MDITAPATELAAALRRRDLSPVELLDACLARVDAVNPSLNAIVWRNDDEARRKAQEWEKAISAHGTGDPPLPPFAGVPIPIKDLTPVAGWPVTYGSHAAPEGPSTESELVVEAFETAGFVLCGRTNTPELGPITIAENLRYGVSRNPWDPSRTPGGSSGGAGAAVASGMFPVAHGNDGGGSIRIPSSCCGLVGLKPSRGRVPSRLAPWLGASTEGALCRTVADTAAVLDVISHPDPLALFQALPATTPYADEVGRDPGHLRIGILRRAPFDMALAEAPLAGVDRAAGLLSDAGHEVPETEIELASFEMLAAFLNVVSSGLGDYPQIDFEKVEPHVAEQYRQARQVDSITFIHSLRELQAFTRSLGSAWGRQFDVLVTPTMAIEPPAAGTLLDVVHANPQAPPEEVIAMAVFTAPFNVTGQPAVSLPLHWSESGLPIGVQFIGSPFDEATLIRLASQLETLSPWADRRPPSPGPTP